MTDPEFLTRLRDQLEEADRGRTFPAASSVRPVISGLGVIVAIAGVALILSRQQAGSPVDVDSIDEPGTEELAEDGEMNRVEQTVTIPESCVGVEESERDQCLDQSPASLPVTPSTMPPPLECPTADFPTEPEASSILVLSCGTGEAGDQYFVPRPDLAGIDLAETEGVAELLAAWLDGPTPEEESEGLVAPFSGRRDLVPSINSTPGHVDLIFDDQILQASSSWGLPGWDARFTRELGWQLALAGFESMSIRFGSTCFGDLLAAAPSAVECERIGTAE